MTDRRLQKRYLVTGLQPLLAYNVVMSLPANQQHDEPTVSTRRAAGPRRARARFCRAGLVVVALIGIGVLAAACGGGSSGPRVASVGKTTTTTGPSAAQNGSAASRENSALAYVNCMRTHGEPNMPEPNFSGGHINININASSGVDPSSPQFTAASNVCKRLLPTGGPSASNGNTITPADQADYLKAAACMRSHGISNFPDPAFQNNSVEFNNSTPIDTNSSQYKSALATCQKLIPAGLPYSSTSGS
jgi:hypothetical protein